MNYDCAVQCVKVSQLRKDYGPDMNLEKWCEDEDNVLCCRNGRVFIYEDGEKHCFAYKKSKWHNPYKVGKDGTLERVCDMFHNHILESNLKDDLEELVGKTLGCFCNQSGLCHVQVLQELVTLRDDLPPLREIPESFEQVKVTEKVKCSATTKKGKKCSRNARADSEYCTQHRNIMAN